jgi:hypothetical protein
MTIQEQRNKLLREINILKDALKETKDGFVYNAYVDEIDELEDKILKLTEDEWEEEIDEAEYQEHMQEENNNRIDLENSQK